MCFRSVDRTTVKQQTTFNKKRPPSPPLRHIYDLTPSSDEFNMLDDATL